MKERWFECPCGAEYWTPDIPLDLKFKPSLRDCRICGTRLGRRVLYRIEAGTDHTWVSRLLLRFTDRLERM